jgi:hypothetical protein
MTSSSKPPEVSDDSSVLSSLRRQLLDFPLTPVNYCIDGQCFGPMFEEEEVSKQHKYVVAGQTPEGLPKFAPADLEPGTSRLPCVATQLYHGIACAMLDAVVPGVDYHVLGPADLYTVLARQLLRLRASPDYTEDAEDAILDAMDPVWWKMSAEEQQWVGEAMDRLAKESTP